MVMVTVAAQHSVTYMGHGSVTYGRPRRSVRIRSERVWPGRVARMPYQAVEVRVPYGRAARLAPAWSLRLNRWRPVVSRPTQRSYSTATAPTGFPAVSVLSN